MNKTTYLDFLAKFGVGGAHPGGIELSKEIFNKENIHKAFNILDVGCGTGQTAAYLAFTYGANVIGIDNNKTMVEKAKQRMARGGLPVKIVEGSIENIQLQDEQFDIILSESVLSFVNKQHALKEIYRLLKNGGRFIAIEHTMNEKVNKKDENEIKQFFGFDSLFMKEDWVNVLKQTGFHHIEVEKSSLFDSEADFHFSEDIGFEHYEIMDNLVDINKKYEDVLSYRIYFCTK